MWDTIKKNVVYPLSVRAGTAVSTAVVSYGVTQQHADWLAIGVTGVCGLLWDLAMSYIRRSKIESKAVQRTLNDLTGRTVAERDYSGIGGGQ